MESVASHTPLPDTTSLGAVRLRVGDLARSLAFYADLLGLRAVRGPAVGNGGAMPEAGSAVLSASVENPLITLEARPGVRLRPPGTPGLYHFAILYPDRPSLARAILRLRSASWPFQGFSDHAVSEAAYLADPDGNGVELYADRPRAVWRRDGRIVMTTLPLDLRDLLAQADGAEWTGADARTRIGHIHYHVADLARAERFWAGLIGLDVVTRDYPGALFLSAGGYHHHVAVNTWSPMRSPGAADVAGLLAMTLRVPDAGARDGIRVRLETAGIAVQEAASGLRFADTEGNAVILTG